MHSKRNATIQKTTPRPSHARATAPFSTPRQRSERATATPRIDRTEPPWTDRYRQTRSACNSQLGTEIAYVAADLCDPVSKLRFLRDVIENQNRLPVSFKYRVMQPLRRAAFKIWSWLSHLDRSPRKLAYTAIKRTAVVVGVCTAFGTVAIMARSATTQSDKAATRWPAPASKPIVAPAPTPSVAPALDALPPVAESLPADTLGMNPTTIWLADHGPNWELYSNGLRIETTYTVEGEPRHYRIHRLGVGLLPRINTKPVGILFHTSESDLWPLDSEFNKQLRRSSTALMKYVRQQRAYNYVIDRFGRVFRIVDDETRANHAGHAIWANGKDIYLDLNSAFIGVSFESRFDGGRVLPITRAQLIAGRNLTNYLRQRFAIAPEMCVTHGLTSVSPKEHLIGYHVDWVRGFPFAAFGLPDQYKVEPPSIALFGFSYNDELVRMVGDGWPGMFAAETALEKEAVDKDMTVQALRAQDHALYAKWARETRRADDVDAAYAETDAHRTADKSMSH